MKKGFLVIIVILITIINIILFKNFYDLNIDNNKKQIIKHEEIVN